MTTALLLVGIQKDHFPPNGRTPSEKSLEASTKAERVLRAFRDKKLPVIHIQHISTHPDATSLLPCTKGAEFHDSVTPTKGENIIKKHYPNSFKDTQLKKYLTANNISHLVICGMTTHSSIDSTVRAAADLGFSCTVLQDACVSCPLEFSGKNIPADNVHTAFMAALATSYANVINTDELLHKVSGRVAEEMA